MRKLAAEEFRKSLHFDLVNAVKLEPATAARNNHSLAGVLLKIKVHFYALPLFLDSFIIGVRFVFGHAFVFLLRSISYFIKLT